MFNTRIISFMNNKGGCHKSTLCFNLAKNYLKNGRIVTVIDFDQQENIKTMLPEITMSGLSPDELREIEADYVLVDTGPTFVQDHIQLMLQSDLILVPVILDRLDIEQTMKMLKTAQALTVTEKIRLIPIHSGTNTQMYKSLMPFIEKSANDFGVSLLSSMRKSQAVPQANLQNKTVFEINSPPNIRNEFKAFFKEVGSCLKTN